MLLSASLCLLTLVDPLQASLRPGAERSGAGWVERRLTTMGTWLELGVRARDRATALAASERAVGALEACEARLSTWRDDSELARLNRADLGAEIELSPELAADLARVAHLWRATEGAFDPGLGALVAAWGLRSGGRAPGTAELESALEVGGFAAFELRGRSARRRHPGAAIEEGGFGKGIGLDAALQTLRADGVSAAILDLGGQIAALGDAWATTLADPRARSRPVLELCLEPGSLATSGNSERGLVVDGIPRGHLLDPVTGQPVEDFGSLSVWAGDATSADGLSTGLYVMGPAAAFRWWARHPEVELVVLLPREGGGWRALASAGLRGRLRPLVPELELSFVEAHAPDFVPNPLPPR